MIPVSCNLDCNYPKYFLIMLAEVSKRKSAVELQMLLIIILFFGFTAPIILNSTSAYSECLICPPGYPVWTTKPKWVG